MPLPTVEKTWQFDVNRQFAMGSVAFDTARPMLRHIKDQMKVWGWTVKGSCNSVTTGMDGTDRWATDANLVWASTDGGAKSWIVLVHPDGGFEILICLRNSTTGAHNLFLRSSVAGFTGGSTTAIPTATDHMPHGTTSLTSPQYVLPATGIGAFAGVLHMMQSTDNNSLRIVGFNGGISQSGIIIERLGDAVPGFPTRPLVACGQSIAGNVGWWVFSQLYSSTAQLACMTAGGTPFYVHLTCEGGTTTTNGQLPNAISVPNEFSGEHAIYPVGAASATAGARGRHGRMVDLWWNSGSSLLVEGSTHPDDGSRQLVCIGSMVFPWNGTVPVVA
jgi:hypothetical protein